MKSLQASTLSYDVNELTEVKLEKTEPDEHDRNSDETRHWIVCPGGVLKEVKAEPTIDFPDIWVILKLRDLFAIFVSSRFKSRFEHLAHIYLVH